MKKGRKREARAGKYVETGADLDQQELGGLGYTTVLTSR